MRKILTTLLLAGASSVVFAGPSGNQVITPNPLSQVAAAGSTVSVGIDYNTEPVSDTNGLGLRVHFDSSQLTFNSATYGPDAVSLSQPVSGPTADDADCDNDPDTIDCDGDPDTDQFIILSWVTLGGGFPGVDPATLASVDFTTAADFSGSTLVNFSASSTPPGFQLGPNSATISSDGSDPVVPDPDPTPIPDADLIGQPFADADTALRDAGFTTVDTVEVFDADATPGTVLSVVQDPATSTATLTIATDQVSGPGPGPGPGPGGPDFSPGPPAQPIPSLSSFGLLLLTPLLGLVVMFRRKK